ncbi:MAG: winged helix-turn-helix transcriptional regulator [Candidatus Eremiobacteraeota bacterium]|nr:winged helix-turn-helix transcriptional regulator [Candidatus Eremiobacteraeota bacterium]
MRVPYIVLNRGAREPLYRQIVRQITGAIADNTLGAEARLPSSRSLARILRVSRNTVVTAYSELIANALIRATRGAGVRVNGAAPLSGMPLAGMRGLIEAAHFPATVLQFQDFDANALYIRY